jgi:hypothetical protein
MSVASRSCRVLTRGLSMSEGREELHDLIDSLPDDQVEQVLADVRRGTNLSFMRNGIPGQELQ